MNNKNNVWWKWIYWFTFAVAVIAVYKTLDSFNDIIYWIKNLISIIFPFIMAILISYILYIPCNKVESVYKKCKNKFINKRARKISIFTVYILLMLACALIIKFVVPSIYKSIIDLVNNLPAYYEQAINYIKELPEVDRNSLHTEYIAPVSEAEKIIVRRQFDPNSDKLREGFDGSQQRQYDFSTLLITDDLKNVTADVTADEKIDSRSSIFIWPSDCFLGVNEVIVD